MGILERTVGPRVHFLLQNLPLSPNLSLNSWKMGPVLTGKVCLVTGAGRGIGKGIALQLGEAGATVYITGRTQANLDECAAEIKARGGHPIPVQMDHGKDDDVEKLFKKIASEQSGKLDVLVNNAYAGVNMIFTSSGKKFWETDPIATWDCINGVGLRGHYHCTSLASRLMVENKQGLIVNVSSPGGLKYLFNVAYGIGKAGCDRMAADCAFELKKSNVAMISLWPGAVKTEYIQENILSSSGSGSGPDKSIFEEGETIEFAGKAIVHLAARDQAEIMQKTGKIVLTSDLSSEYNFTENDGTVPTDFRQINMHLARAGHTWIAALLPNFVRIPNWVLHYASYKF